LQDRFDLGVSPAIGGTGSFCSRNNVAKNIARPSRLRWCSRTDVLNAFRIVGREIRTRCQRYFKEGITQAEACELARRIKDQRDLVRQLADRRNIKHARRLMRLNRRLQKRLIGIVAQAGLDKDILIFK
jgi:hypothetical protein